ncbi:lactonase family protein [Oceanobacillus sp. 1P07AA]|uniref:lactonase family protein n=1 Tax=Oceanobacillus sp. 1P07AA TaxID=3132293 RepID=UPI0039A61A76
MNSLKDIFVGSYGERNEETIHWLSFDPYSGKLGKIAAFDGIDHPSFLEINRSKSCLYAISEVEQGEVICYGIDPIYKQLTEWSRFPTHGGPCYVEVNGDYVFVSNYTGGNLVIYRTNENGNIEEETDCIHISTESRLHTIRRMPKSDYYVATDLGKHKLYFFYFNKEIGKLQLRFEVETPYPSGPRHVDFHPEIATLYVVNEFDSTILVYAYDLEKELVQLKQRITTLPSECNQENYGAEVQCSGKFLYASNRGYDSITTYQIINKGLLRNYSNLRLGSKWPRHFQSNFLGEKYIIVANEHSNELTVLRKTQMNEFVSSEERYAVPRPVCVKVV